MTRLSKPQADALRFYRARESGQPDAAVIHTGTREALVYRGFLQWTLCAPGLGDGRFCLHRVTITPAGRAALERHEQEESRASR